MSLSHLLDHLDPRPDRRGREFERICVWYLRSAPEYREKFRRVWLWSEWPGAWGADAGIDIVAEEVDGSRWAIQAKAYDQNYAIKKADVDSFLSESARPEFAFRLLIATTDRLGPAVRRTLDGQREPVGYIMRSQLELARLAWPSSPADLRPRRTPRKKPLPHIREAIRAVARGLRDERRGQLVMACGTGKTLGAMWISERMKSKRTLVLVPSLSLLAQTLREWSANATGSFDYLVVCSDETVADPDELVQHTGELGIPVTTDPDRIAAFLRRRSRSVVFATYQSSSRIAAAQKSRVPRFDLAIADEAHRCAGRGGTEFTTILDEQRIKSKRRLFMTATPRLYTSHVRRAGELVDVDIASMDDRTVFGPVLHQLSFGEAIRRDLLSDYQVVVVGVDDALYRSYVARGELVTRDGTGITDARTLAGQIGLAKAMRKYGLRRVVCFHSRVKAARRFSVEMPDVIRWMPRGARPAGAVWSQHVSGAMTSGHRDRLLLRFRDLAPRERGLLSNARCLGEGVDLPSIDGVAFIDPRRSTIDIVQAVGRAIRKAPDKKVGTIVLPVFIFDEDSPNATLDQSPFNRVWDVLKALRAHDEALGDELDGLRRRVGAAPNSSPRRPGRVKLDIPTGRVGTSFVRAFDARLVEQTTASWEEWFGALQLFVEHEGHCKVPQGYRTENGYPLGSWLASQRMLHRQGALPRERVERLEALEGWAWEPRDAAWEEGFAALERFAEREGHAQARFDYVTADGFRLGGWINKQRTNFKGGTLDPPRQKRLEVVPGWTWDTLEAGWQQGFTKLAAFAKRNGHSRPSKDHRDEDGYQLGAWVAAQRANRKRLSKERTRQLEALPGWEWNTQAGAWKKGYARLQRYVEREGHSRVPVDYRDDDSYRLGNWVLSQRASQRRGGLPEERARRLAAIADWVPDTKEASWEDVYARLRRFAKREGHSRVPQKHKDEDRYPLGTWVHQQRQLHKRGKLSEDRNRQLEALPGWVWTPREARWEDGYARLRQFTKREGHSRAPGPYRDEHGYRLGSWVAVQRQNRRRGELAPERVERLEALPGWTWDPDQARWDDAYARLLRFAKREGHARVPNSYKDPDDYRLGTWVGHRRAFRKQGRLSDERIRLLEAVPGWVWADEGR